MAMEHSFVRRYARDYERPPPPPPFAFEYDGKARAGGSAISFRDDSEHTTPGALAIGWRSV